LDDEDLVEVMAQAQCILGEEATRTRAGFRPGMVIGGEPAAVDTTAGPTVVPSSFADAPRFAYPDPAGAAPVLGSAADLKKDADFVRQIVPELAHMSDSYLTQHSLDKLQKYVLLAKRKDEDKREKDLEARLGQNLERAIARPITINHQDNRATILHPARFLPGAAISLEASWLEARKLWGRDPAEAVAEFDLLALGLPGCIPAKAWELLHQPGSRELSIKLFTVANVARASQGVKTVATESEEGLVLRESLKELSEMAELKTAFRNLKIAAQLVRPWDFSFLVMECFLVSTDYLEAQLSGVKKAPVIAGFLDHVIRCNAANWLQNKPFMSLQGLKSLWDPWWAGHKGEAVSVLAAQKQGGGGGQSQGAGHNSKKKFRQGQQQQDGYQGQQGQQGQGGQQGQQSGRRGYWGPSGHWAYGKSNLPAPEFSGPPALANICRNYNEKKCQNTYNDCVVNSRHGPFRLYHVCSHTETVNGVQKLCGGKHPKPDHK
jgi:hypothetical protein